MADYGLMIHSLKPPPTLACHRVLEYAIVGKSEAYSGHSNLFRGDEEVGPVPYLAICYDAKQSRFDLHHCNQDWNILGTESYESLEKAKASAERIYPGVAALWADAGVTEHDAARHLDEIWGGRRCNFCGRTPLDFENPRFIQKNEAWICESCVKACYELLQNDQ